MITLIGKLDKIGTEEATVKGEKEERYAATLKLKKIAYEKSSENIKPETGDPWFNLKITSLNEDNLEELLNKRGREFKITIEEMI